MTFVSSTDIFQVILAALQRMDRRDTIALYSHVNMALRVPTVLVGRQMQQDEIHQGQEEGLTVHQPEGPHQGDRNILKAVTD